MSYFRACICIAARADSGECNERRLSKDTDDVHVMQINEFIQFKNKIKLNVISLIKLHEILP